MQPLFETEIFGTSSQYMSKSSCRLPQIFFYRGFFINKKGPGTSFHATYFFKIFIKKVFYFVILHTLAKFPPYCVYFQSYSGKCFRHLMKSWNLRFKISKIWISQGQEEFLQWNENSFPKFKGALFWAYRVVNIYGT